MEDFLQSSGHESKPDIPKGFFDRYSDELEPGNPEWRAMTGHLLVAQWIIDDQDPDESDASVVVNTLNDTFDALRLLGACATIDGRIRLPADVDWGGLPDAIRDLPVYQDDRGEYRIVTELQVVCGLIDLRPKTTYMEDGDELTLCHTFIGPEDDVFDEGQIFIYPGDIYTISFKEETPGAMAEWVQYNRSGVYRQLLRTIPSDMNSLKDVVRGLKDFIVRDDDPELLKRIGSVIAHRMGIDKDVAYNMTVHGLVGTVDEDDDCIFVEYAGTVKHARCLWVIMRPCEDEETSATVFRPTLVCAVQAAQWSDMLEARLVPAESLVSMQKIHPRQRDFAGVTLRAYADTQEIMDSVIGTGETSE